MCVVSLFGGRGLAGLETESKRAELAGFLLG